MVDLNNEKKPNRIGFDIFPFVITSVSNFGNTSSYYVKFCRTVEQLQANPAFCQCDFTNDTPYNHGAGCTSVALNDPKYWDYIKKFK